MTQKSKNRREKKNAMPTRKKGELSWILKTKRKVENENEKQKKSEREEEDEDELPLIDNLSEDLETKVE